METQKILICTLLTAIGVTALLSPLVNYIVKGWFAKRNDIMDGLSNGARVIYFKMYEHSSNAPSEEEAPKKFEELYDKWYGRKNFILPSILLALAVLVAATAVLFTALTKVKYIENPFISLPDPAMSALAGAYMWVVNDFISRGRRLDFSPSDVRWALLRIIIAIPMGYAFSSMVLPEIASLISFSLGAFPLDTLTTMLRRVTNKKLGIDETADSTSDDIIKLQGVNRTIVERLYNEDVITIVQIAYGDPVRIVMRSNLTFNFVTDCMNQALVWMYLKDSVSIIRPFGLRGAIEIKNLINAYDNDKSDDVEEKRDHEQACAAFPVIAKALNQDEATLQIVFREISEDPYCCFLHEVWSSEE